MSVSSIYSGSFSSSVIDSTPFQTSSSKTLSFGVLDDVLVLPNPPAGAKKKRKPALNSKAVCITEDEILEKRRIMKRFRVRKRRK